MRYARCTGDLYQYTKTAIDTNIVGFDRGRRSTQAPSFYGGVTLTNGHPQAPSFAEPFGSTSAKALAPQRIRAARTALRADRRKTTGARMRPCGLGAKHPWGQQVYTCVSPRRLANGAYAPSPATAGSEAVASVMRCARCTGDNAE